MAKLTDMEPTKIVSLLNQGVATALLALLLWKADAVVVEVQKGYDRNAAELQAIAKQRDETIDKVIAQWREDRDLMLRLLTNMQDEVENINAELGSS